MNVKRFAATSSGTNAYGTEYITYEIFGKRFYIYFNTGKSLPKLNSSERKNLCDLFRQDSGEYLGTIYGGYLVQDKNIQSVNINNDNSVDIYYEEIGSKLDVAAQCAVINLTNHGKETWSKEQINGVLDWVANKTKGQYSPELFDITFPNISSYCDEEAIRNIVDKTVKDIKEKYGAYGQIAINVEGPVDFCRDFVNQVYETTAWICLRCTTERNNNSIKFVRVREYNY